VRQATLALIVAFAVVANAVANNLTDKPLYTGILTGYGSTSWGHMVSADSTTLIALATPVDASDSGIVWGALLGYQFSPNFALETTYVHYDNTRVKFLDYSFYTPILEINSKSSSLSMVGKFIAPIPWWELYGYADAGIAVTMRRDALANRNSVGAAFGLGMLKGLSENVMADLSFQFHTGYAISEMKPALDYIPFLFSGQLRLIYRVDPQTSLKIFHQR
jgi:opacity protein-like surface antigen